MTIREVFQVLHLLCLRAENAYLRARLASIPFEAWILDAFEGAGISAYPLHLMSAYEASFRAKLRAFLDVKL